MSVMMGLRLMVDPARFEAVAREKQELMNAIAARGKEMGAIHHMFLAGDSEVMVADEWPSEEAFQAFFEEQGEKISALMAEAEVGNEPQPVFWRPLDTSDSF
jgi:heme-degrading monooxygenase HmoA